MNALRKALADYFVVRRALGFKLYRAEKLLAQFLTFLEERGEEHLTIETALAWATLPQRGQTWAYARLSVVRRFANHLRGIDPATEVPPPHLLIQKKGRATPYRKRSACGVLRRGAHFLQSWPLTGVLLEDSRRSLHDRIRDHYASAEVEAGGEGCAAG
jgi:hypothetical protein